MRSFKKLTSVLLVAVMVLGMFAMMPMSASAATESTITVKSNVMDDVTPAAVTVPSNPLNVIPSGASAAAAVTSLPTV